jgi:ribonuclease H2 subunit A
VLFDRVKDSKSLTENQRDRIFGQIQKQNNDMGWSVKILSPNTISNTSLRRRKYNLNELSHDTAIELVRQTLAKGVDVGELYVDTVGPKDKYQMKLRKLFPTIGKITVENKADSKFHVVSAASICAKVVRDQAISEWKFPEGSDVVPCDIDYGSGYPGGECMMLLLTSTDAAACDTTHSDHH